MGKAVIECLQKESVAGGKNGAELHALPMSLVHVYSVSGEERWDA